ncbi:MAG: pyruvate:ferredoxin (flavodoxin) oxidoreductase [Clostridiales bacterium]|nr:pyruvate:ferredoxin (flavodoxin) oxidoreductase [Clostridiales bacterium]
MKKQIIDACEATAQIAYKLSQVIPVYPITPSSPMAEYCSKLSSKGQKNILGQEVKIIEMQSEAGVAGLMHGALLGHSLSSTFSSSQGLLLMIPNMYKMAGECLPAVMHIASRSVASHALSIFCDHSDVFAARGTGFSIIASNSVQDSHYMAIASHLIALQNNAPILHFFDGFRTSHEIQKIDTFEDSELKILFKEYLKDYNNSAKDFQFGTAQNPDTFFQNKIKNASHYAGISDKIEEAFNQINLIANTNYHCFEYYGHKQAENIVVAMGSACETIEQYLKENKSKKIGLIKVRVYRPFDSTKFLSILPKGVKKITVLDRTLEQGAQSPLYLDCVSALQGLNLSTFSGIYGLGGKEFTLSDVHTVYENMTNTNKTNFTVGINDDVLHSSLNLVPYKSKEKAFEIKIYGLGSDGSVSASKSTIKILGEKLNKNVQGYFEYDSKKSGSLTTSHLRISDQEIQSEYLLEKANIISINNFSFVNKYDCLKGLKQNGIVLLNTIFNANELNKVLPISFVQTLKKLKAKLFIIDAQSLARKHNLGSKINIIMQAVLFKTIGLMNDKEIYKELGVNIEKSFSVKGKDVVKKNLSAMKDALSALVEIDINSLNGTEFSSQCFTNDAFYNDIMKPIASLKGNEIAVSKFSKDGSVPLETSKFEKRNIASRLPNWIKENCIQCGHCVLACPHSALSSLLVESKYADDSFSPAMGLKEKMFKVLLSPEDCTGCGVCANTCPAIKKALAMEGAEKLLDEKKEEYKKSKILPTTKQNLFATATAKGLQFEKSLFEFSGACAGCGETPYIKILTMLNGSNLMIANATGCSSIYGGTFGSCPYGKDENGGIFWANSLFEDNSEFGLGLKLSNTYTKNKDKKVWIIGGDGWANDIGFGGLDHILASGENVNILVLDNQSYSNTGGQASKATPTGASVKLADSGKTTRKKNLGQIALSYKDVFVGQIALGGDINHTIKTLKEAQDYQGTSIVIAYAPCINQGFEMSDMMTHSKQAVQSGFWPMYTYNPITNQLVLKSDYNEKLFDEFLSSQRRFAQTKENGKSSLLEMQKNQAFEELETLKDKSQN